MAQEAKVASEEEYISSKALDQYTKTMETTKDGMDHDMESMLKLDGDENEADNGNDNETDHESGNADEKLLTKLVNDDEEAAEVDNDGDSGNTKNNGMADDIVASTGSGLLESLTTDIEKYHKKVQLKKKKFDDSAIAMEKKITRDLNAAKRNLKSDNDDPSQGERFEGDQDDSVTNENATDDYDNEHNSRGSKRRKFNTRNVTEWTKAEDDAIVYYKEEMKYSWKRIEALLEHKHSWQAIQMRYLRNHKSRNDEWSRFMEVKLINAIRKDWETRWKRIGSELGRDFTPERCINKNIEICKKMELPYYHQVFNNKDILQGYKNQFNDIKEPEAHKKLLLVYMGLDSITYEDSDNDEEGEKSPSGDKNNDVDESVNGTKNDDNDDTTGSTNTGKPAEPKTSDPIDATTAVSSTTNGSLSMSNPHQDDDKTTESYNDASAVPLADVAATAADYTANVDPLIVENNSKTE